MCSVTPTLLAAVFAVGEFLFCPCLASLSVFHPTMVLVQQKEQGERLVTSGENFTDRSRQPSSPESTQLWVDRSENPIDEISEIVFNFGWSSVRFPEFEPRLLVFVAFNQFFEETGRREIIRELRPLILVLVLWWWRKDKQTVREMFCSMLLFPDWMLFWTHRGSFSVPMFVRCVGTMWCSSWGIYPSMPQRTLR